MRWHIVQTAREQSLAEHSFNVAQIALSVLRAIGPAEGWEGRVALAALDHDIDEVITGDAPTPSKGKKAYDFSGPMTPEKIVKIADIIEAYIFIREYGLGRHAEAVCEYCYDAVGEMLVRLPKWYRDPIEDILNKLTVGNYRI